MANERVRPTGTVEISWRNGDDEFCISAVRDVLLLEEKCGCGIYEVADRLSSVLRAAQQNVMGGRAYVNDIREVIRVGLMGAGMTPEKANKTVVTCVDGFPLAHSVLVAHKIITAYLIGVPGDELGKTAAAGAKTDQVSSTMTVASAAPQSTAPEAQ